MKWQSYRFEVKLRGGQQNHYHGLSEGRLWPVQVTGWEGPLAESVEGQRGPGRLDILQGGSLKDTGAGCPHVPQDEPVGKAIGLAEQGALAGTQKKRRAYHLWKKGKATQEEYRGLVTSCREEIRKSKAQLELNPATVVRDNKKMLLQIYQQQKEGQGESPSLTGCEG